MLRTTPFHPRTSALCLSHAWRRWAGYVVASSYELVHDREYHAIRNAAALFDVSPLYKYRVTGRDAARLLDRVITRSASNAKLGQVLYTPWCDSAGKMIDDGTVSRLGEQEFRMTSAEPNLRWLGENAVGMEVSLEDVSDQIAALALQGPLARTILEQVLDRSDTELAKLRYFRITNAVLRGVDVQISRTGYTGDLGYEIWMRPDDALKVWDTLIDVGRNFGITPAGILALDMARVEAGLILLDVDYVSAHRALIPGQTSSPYEVGLGWTVDLKKEYFNGRECLAEEFSRGPSWKLVGLDISWTSLETLWGAVGLPPRVPSQAWRTSTPVYAGDWQVGYATSGSWSPLLKKYIALAHVEAEHAALGTTLGIEMKVEHRPRIAEARVVKTPFFDPERKRA